MKKLFILMFCMILLTVSVSAFEFDNVKRYDEKTRTIEIRNSFLGLEFLSLDKVSTIKLNTNIENKVAVGYQKVAEFDLNIFEDYDSAFQEFELYDLNSNSRKFTRDIDYKVRSYETVIVNDYITECENVSSKTNESIYRECNKVLVGNHTEQREVWTDLGESNFKDNDTITIGIFTEVKIGDRVEWIPNLFGVRIEEWATWTAELNVDLELYYKMDTGDGAIAVDSLGGFNATLTGSVNWTLQGIIKNATVWNASTNTTGTIGNGFNFSEGAGTKTLSMWVNYSVVPQDNKWLFDNGGSGTNNAFGFFATGGNFTFSFYQV